MSDQPSSGAAASQAKTESPEQLRQRQLQAFMRAPVPKIYANGLGINVTATDISVVFLENSAPAGIVTMAHSTVKSLIMDLSVAIKTFEERTGEKVKDIRELMSKLQTTKK